MNTPAHLQHELRQRILQLPGVTERQNAGIHEDAFFVGGTMFMHIHGHGHCDIRLSKGDQERVLAEGMARPHRWAPEAGYVTFVVTQNKDLGPAMERIRISHRHFAQNGSAGPAQPGHSHPPAGVVKMTSKAPCLSLTLLSPAGLRKREVWEQTWTKQREEDAIDVPRCGSSMGNISQCRTLRKRFASEP